MNGAIYFLSKVRKFRLNKNETNLESLKGLIAPKVLSACSACTADTVAFMPTYIAIIRGSNI